MDDPVNDFKNILPSHIKAISVDDSHILLSNDRYPFTILDIPLTQPLPTISEIETRFAQLNIDPSVPTPADDSCLFPTDGVFDPMKPTGAFDPMKPNGDWYFNPESNLFTTEYTLNHQPSKSTIDRIRFPNGARIYPMSPLKPPRGIKASPKKFYTLDSDSDPEPKYPFDDRDL